MGDHMVPCIELEEIAIVVDSKRDNVAVVIKNVRLPVVVLFPDGLEISLEQDLIKGVRLSLTDIHKGEPVIQYGNPFGISKGVMQGECITPDNIENLDGGLDDVVELSPPRLSRWNKKFPERYFQGYVRSDGKVGTRNIYLVIPTSMCASETAVQIAEEATRKFLANEMFTNVDGVVAISTTEGCGCASNIQIQRFLRVLQQYIRHPNVGGVLVVDLGCEQTNYQALENHLRSNGVVVDKDVLDWLTIQQMGGVQKSIRYGVDVIHKHLPVVNSIHREACSISQLVVGTECGGSDAFSGITANPLIGTVVDRVVEAGGSGILSEVPEMFGAERLLMQRMRSDQVVAKFRKMVHWYKGIAKSLNVDMSNNLVPENVAGGLINPCIKSLGAITKGGTGPIEDVLDYGEPISSVGLNIMQGPGNDMESVTGMVASGANIICFSTGKGTVTGSALAPVVKIASNNELYERMDDDMDFNGGALIGSSAGTRERLENELFDKVISIASGELSKSEKNGQRQFQVWTAGKLSL